MTVTDRRYSEKRTEAVLVKAHLKTNFPLA